MKIEAMQGYKLFKETDDGITLVRILGFIKKDGKIVRLKVSETTSEATRIYECTTEDLKGFTPLEPDGLLTFNIVSIKTADGTVLKDVIVTASKILNVKIGDTLPYAVCRQNITDVFYNLLVKDESEMIVGLSVNRDTCPANFDYGLMLACNGIEYSEHINFYRNDTIEHDILPMIKILKFDTVLENLYKTHLDTVGLPLLLYKKEDNGWCKNLSTLLKENNFQEDINQMLGITSIDTVISDYIVTKQLPNGEEYSSLRDDLKDWLSSIFKVAINDITVLQYDHDINLAEFNDTRYFLLRDGKGLLYLAVYTIDKEHFAEDLKVLGEKKDFSDEFRINFYNKYNKYNKLN